MKPPTNAQLAAMNREQLAVCYLHWVGYDPFVDSPNTSPEEVRDTLIGYFAELAKNTRLSKDPDLITDGRQLSGAAMPRIVKDFRNAMIGRRIVDAGYYNIDGAAFPILVLDNGDSIIAQCDDECNSPGVLSGGKSTMLCQTHIIK